MRETFNELNHVAIAYALGHIEIYSIFGTPEHTVLWVIMQTEVCGDISYNVN